MHAEQKKTRVLISPKNKEKFLEHLGRCKLTEECRDRIAKCEFYHIELLPDNRELNISLKTAEITSSRELSPLGDYFRKIFPDLRAVNFDIDFDRAVDLHAIVTSLWSDIVDHVIKVTPSCQVWLPGAAVSLLNEKTIRIEAGDETAYYTLVDRQADKTIERFVRDKFCIDCRVFIDKTTVVAVEKLGDFEYREQSEAGGNGASNGSNGSNGSAQQAWQPSAPVREPAPAPKPGASAGQAPPKKAYEAARQNSAPPQPLSEDVFFGKKISDRLVPAKIGDIREEAKNIMIEGIVIAFDARLLKSGKKLTAFSVTDKSDTIVCKIFSDPKQEIKLKAGAVVKVTGGVRYDAFEKDFTIIVNDVNKGKMPERKDNAEKKRIELHAHSKMSALDGMTEIADFVKLAKKWGHPAVALTDHGVVQGFPEFAAAAKKEGIKPIYGMEGYLIDDSVAALNKKEGGVKVKVPSPFHIIILAATQQGLRNLYELVTLSHIEYFYKRPRITRSELEKRREGLILGTACEAGELIRGIVNGKSEEEIEKIASFYDYLEIQPIRNNSFFVEKMPELFKSDEELIALNRKVYELGKKLGKPICATSDMHYLNPEDELFRKILFAGQKYENVENSCPLFFPTTEDMLNEFKYLGPAACEEVVIENPAKVAAMVGDIAPIPKDKAFPVMEGAEEKIRSMSIANAVKKYGDPLPPTVQKRLDHELNCIIKNGFATLYLIAHELVKKSLEDGYLVGSRGSVGSSLVATFTNITEVNPLPPHYYCKNENCKYSEFFEDLPLSSGFDLADKNCPKCDAKLKKDGQKIPFEVFLGFDGDKTPDIDLNFSGDYQPRIHEYVGVIFGEKNVFRAGTIATIADKTAFGFVKTYLEERSLTRRPAEMNRLAIGCSGVKRTTGQHPGGIMIVPMGRDIHEFTPVNYPANDRNGGVVTTHLDYHSIHDNLLKLDLLGHDDPTFIRMLEDFTDVNIADIEFDDKNTMSLFSKIDALGIEPKDINGISLGTLGIPEFGTSFVRGMLEETRPTTFGELVRISGLSHGTDVWLNNAQSYIKSGDAKLAEVISVRDDIINYLLEHGVEPLKSFNIMENVRKGKGLKPDMVEVMQKHNIPQWYIDSCNKIKYMFPKAHAAAYVMMAFRIAYFKVNYPLAFYATYFSTKGLSAFDAAIVLKGRENVAHVMQEIAAKGKEATQKEADQSTIFEVVLESMARGVKYYPVDLYESDAFRFKIKNDDGLLCPFNSVGGLGDSAAKKIFDEAQVSPFISVEDFKDRTKANKNVIDILMAIGTLKSLPETDQLSFFD